MLRRHADRLILPPFRRTPRLGRLADMARWWRRHEPSSITCASRGELHRLVRTRVGDRTFDYLEFGVSTGESFRWWVDATDNPDARFVGFDTFEGIPEAWGSQPIGTYAAEGRAPEIEDPRADFVVGRFEDSLPTWTPEPALRHPLVVHLDADLYSSTTTALEWLRPHLEAGDLLIFDELLDVGTAHEEFAAFADFDLGLPYEVIANTAFGAQVAMVLRASPGAR